MKVSNHRASRRAPHALAAALALALAGVTEPGSAIARPANHAHPGATLHTNPTLAQLTGDFSHLRAAFAQSAATRAATSMPARAPATRRVQSLSDSGPGSLRATLSSAVDGDVIDLGNLRGRITLASSLVTSANVTLKGPGRDVLTIDGARHGRVITSNGSLTLSDMTITGGAVVSGSAPPYVGGCLSVQGDLNMQHATISGCSVGDATTPNAYGGAIAVGGKSYFKYCTISDSTVTANQFAVGGGVISIGQSALLGSTISGNQVNQVTAPEDSTPGTSSVFIAAGGGLASVGSSTATGSTYTAMLMSSVTGNSVTAAGGVYSNGTDVLPAAGYGSGGGVLGATPTVVASTISGNTVQASGRADGGGMYAITFMPPPASVAPTMASLTLGGAVPNGTSSSFKYADISGNSVTSSNGEASGGGLASTMPLAIMASAFANNTAHTTGSYWAGGGGIASKQGGLSIQASTVSGNHATSDDADGNAWAGGIAMWSTAPLQMINSTVSGNQSTAPAGGYSGGISASVVQIANSTIAFNTAQYYGGGITLYGNTASSQTISSTIIASNTATEETSGADLYANSNPAVDGDHNLIVSVGTLTWTSSPPITTDPQLLPLAFNGGPTKTHALPIGSAAVDAGSNPTSATTDQRNYARVVGANADIGAYELDTDRIFTNGFDARIGGP